MRARLKKFPANRPVRAGGADFCTDRRVLGRQHRSLRSARRGRDLSRQWRFCERTIRPDQASRPRRLLFGLSVLHTGAPVDVPQIAQPSPSFQRPRPWSGSNSRPRNSRPAPALMRRRARLRPFPDDPKTRLIGAASGCAARFNSVSRPQSRCQDHSMFRYHALGGVSLLAIGSAFSVVPACAQTSLPPVTVDAPRSAAAKPAARKPASRAAARTQVRPMCSIAMTAVSQTARVTPSEARET